MSSRNPPPEGPVLPSPDGQRPALDVARGVNAAETMAAYRARQQGIFAELINKCPFGIYIVDDRMRIVSMNERSQVGAFQNVRPVIGRPFEEAMQILWPDTVAAEIVGHFRHTLETGEPFLSREFIRPRADVGTVEGYEWELHRTRLPEGGFGVICYYYDSTELRDAQRALLDSARQQQLLIEELGHRVKNTLAIVQSLANQTFRQSGIPAEVQSAFYGRLQALGQAQETITRQHWEVASLHDIVAGALDACGVGDRVEVSGEPAWLRPQAGVMFALAMHELATNAIKYGALSCDDGRVTLTWTLDSGPDGRLVFAWREMGGPTVSVPERTGFGSRLLERALAGELKGSVTFDFHPDGLVCTIDAPASSLAGPPAADAPLAEGA